MAVKKATKKKPLSKNKKKGRKYTYRYHKPNPLLFLLKWFLVLGLWAGIGLTILTAWYGMDLPTITAEEKPEKQPAITIQASNGKTIARYGELQGRWMTVETLPPHLIHAVLAIEDRRFYQHGGIDPLGLGRAIFVNLREQRLSQGGSTITQQLAKNLFLDHERTLKRKTREALLALWLEDNMSKDEILSTYLNRVYLGAGTYGVDAASKTYFGKSARDLNLKESAMLAGLLKAPSRYAPTANPALAEKRARVVLNAMKEVGYITEAEAKTATSKDLPTPLPRRKPGESGDSGRYFADWATGRLGEIIGTPEADMTVKTTLDPTIQRVAEKILGRLLRKYETSKNVTQGAIIVMRPDGAILAMTGGRDYIKSQFNRAVQAQRPPGSAFKPFVYLTALQNGWSPSSSIEDSPIKTGQYRPKNFNDEYAGTVTLEEALTRSLNTATVRLASEIEIGPVLSTARVLGIESSLNRDLSLSLGSSGVPLLEMTAAYAALANGGYRVEPYAITEIQDWTGEIAYLHAGLNAREHAVNPRAVRQLDNMLREVVRTGTGRAAQGPFPQAAGKTGTSQDYRDAWFIGYTDRFVAGIWLGNDDNSPMQGVTGGSIPALIWRDLMTAAHEVTGDAPVPPDHPKRSGFGGMLKRLLGR